MIKPTLCPSNQSLMWQILVLKMTTSRATQSWILSLSFLHHLDRHSPSNYQVSSMEGGTEEEARNKLGKAYPQRAPANSASMPQLTATVKTSTRGVRSSKQRQLGRLGNTALGRNVCSGTGEGTEYPKLDGVKPARGSELLEQKSRQWMIAA